jgi:hypothetical protein
MAEYEVFGDTDGILGGRARGQDQALGTPPPTGPSNLDSARLVGDSDILAGRATGGDDRLEGAINLVTLDLVGDARLMRDRAQGGDDLFQGNTGLFNTLHGDAEEMSGRSTGGDDRMEAPAPPFTRTAASSDLFGDARTLSGRAEGGDDTLGGAIGYEGSTARLYGDGFALRDQAQGGDDRLVSRGYADDEMWGDAYEVGPQARTGADTFVFALGNGRDIIHDFERGQDLIDLSAFAGFGVTDMDSLSWRLLEQADGTLLILDAGGIGGNSVLVAGVTGLQAEDFLFG